MKKNRPGTLVTVLCKPEDTNTLMSLSSPKPPPSASAPTPPSAASFPRESVNVHTHFGDVRIKVARVNGHIRQVAPNSKIAVNWQ